jgi:hypothetical protein
MEVSFAADLKELVKESDNFILPACNSFVRVVTLTIVYVLMGIGSTILLASPAQIRTNDPIWTLSAIWIAVILPIARATYLWHRSRKRRAAINLLYEESVHQPSS